MVEVQELSVVRIEARLDLEVELDNASGSVVNRHLEVLSST